jgi:hypothetical protein
MPRILFIVKFRENYDGSCGYDGTPSSFGGLYHSALFVVQMLRAAGVDAKLVQVCDNNDIDREVAGFKPNVVIIEALWVVPFKFTVLTKLHPSVKWVVRCHSEIPFLSYEGIAIEWIKAYAQFPTVFVASNSLYGVRDFDSIIGSGKTLYLPNFYPQMAIREKTEGRTLDIGCFGAIRPLKNQLIQALAAMEFATQDAHGLRFHINTRTEQGGDAVLKNLKALFQGTSFQLIQHHWETRQQFLDTLAQTDVGMQVSFSETFDITAADTVALGIPLVTSHEVTWAASGCKAEETNTASIVAKLRAVTGGLGGFLTRLNLYRLRSFCNESRSVWLAFCHT